ncbi:MAG: transporter substrate-binding domain-containing protein [Alphaproteobacteria bacterium]|nr:transporter substrate-binding domain-containing protein [Alphaproteobacteria bacterium]
MTSPKPRLTKILSIFCLTFACFFLPPISIKKAQAAEFNLVTDNWEPYYGASLDEEGFLAALARAALKEEGHSLKITYFPWARALKMAETHQVDGLFGLYFSKERAQYLVFSDPIYTDGIYLIAQTSLPVDKYETLRDLIPYSIGTSNGWVYSEEFDEADFLNKDVAVNPLMNIRKLLSNRVDIIIASETVFNHLLKANQLTQGPPTKNLYPPIKLSNLHIGINVKNKNATKMITSFNRGLLKIKENGVYAETLRRFGQIHRPIN